MPHFKDDRSASLTSHPIGCGKIRYAIWHYMEYYWEREGERERERERERHGEKATIKG